MSEPQKQPYKRPAPPKQPGEGFVDRAKTGSVDIVKDKRR